MGFSDHDYYWSEVRKCTPAIDLYFTMLSAAHTRVKTYQYEKDIHEGEHADFTRLGDHVLIPLLILRAFETALKNVPRWSVIIQIIRSPAQTSKVATNNGTRI